MKVVQGVGLNPGSKELKEGLREMNAGKKGKKFHVTVADGSPNGCVINDIISRLTCRENGRDLIELLYSINSRIVYVFG